MLIGQAVAEGLTMVTRDKRSDDYGVTLLAASTAHGHRSTAPGDVGKDPNRPRTALD